MKKRQFLMLFVLLALISSTAVAAEDSPLPIGLTDEEMLRLDEIGMYHVRTAPPSGPVRNCAEWEPSQGVIIRWPLGISVSLIKEMSEDLMVTTIVANQSERTSAINSYTSGGVFMAHTEFIIASTNTYWTRDYGPWFVFDGNNRIGIVDHIYNRPRPQDDLIPSVIGAAWGIPVYGMDLITTGGNHMSNGLGRSMSERLVWDENPGKTPQQIAAIMLSYLGNDYTVLEYVESGGIHHIDCWAKFLNPTTILVKSVPSSSSSYALLNARANYLSQQISAWGQPYTVVRVFCPTGTAYTNSIILNKKVLVPTFSTSQDAVALQTYRDAMPGYEVIGFTGSWLSDDAIHCRAMGVPDTNMLFIRHVPLVATGDTINDYVIGCHIVASSGEDLISDSTKVYYSVNGAPFESTPLFATAEPDSFWGTIPTQPGGSVVRYFLRSADNSGRVENHPYIGEPWAHRVKINDVPEITSPDNYTIRISSAFVYHLEWIDTDDSVHTVTFGDYPDWLTVHGDTLRGTSPDTICSVQFTATVADAMSSDTQSVSVSVYACGDADGSGAVDIGDPVFLINYIFAGGPAPDPEDAGDVDCSGSVDIGDVVFLIDFIFTAGQNPCSGC